MRGRYHDASWTPSQARRCSILDSIGEAIVGRYLTHPKRSCMEREYDLFEVLSDGAPMWRQMVAGQENALRKLGELSKQTSNEIRVMHVLTNTLLASTSAPEA
jgi:hypothetical protein